MPSFWTEELKKEVFDAWEFGSGTEPQLQFDLPNKNIYLVENSVEFKMYYFLMML